MKLKIIITLCMCFYFYISSFAQELSTISIENTSFYKISGIEHSSNTVSAKVQMFKFLNKIESDKKKIKLGEILKLKVELDNFSEDSIDEIKTIITLPRGFIYIDDSIRSEDDSIKSVMQEKNRVEIYFNKSLAGKEKREITLSVKTNTSIKRGKNSFKVFSTANYGNYGRINSNVNTCIIYVEEEEIERKGTIIGRVYSDQNSNKEYDIEDIGIPNVKIYLENGHFVITDRDGKFSFLGEKGYTHVLRIDKSTLPKKSKLIPLDSRYNSLGDSIIINLHKEELYKVNFAIQNVDEELLAEIEDRKKIAEKLTTELETVVEKEELTFDSVVAKGNIEDSGYFDDRMNSLTSLIQELEKEKQKELLEKNLKEKPKKIVEDENLEEELKTFNNKLEILNLKDGDIVDEVISVAIKDSMSSKTTLYLNDEEVPQEFVGINGSYPKNNLAYYRYDGIKLKQEKNKITVVSENGGIKRERVIYVNYPSEVDKIMVSKIKKEEIGSSIESIEIKLTLKNSEDLLLREPYFVSIENDSGAWIDPEDLSKDDGIQFIIENGEQILKILPTESNKDINLIVKVANKEKKVAIKGNVSSKETFLTGVIEGRFGFKQKSVNFLQEDLNSRGDNENLNFSYRTAIFSKGNLLNNYDFVMSYDNTKDDEDIFFQNMKKENFYLLTGDDSIKGYEAQSKSRLYLLIENDNVKHLYGDYTVDWSGEDFDIGNYSRSLTGYKFNYKNDKIDIEGFISETNETYEQEEFQGQNSSGPYYLKNRSIVEGSEKIEIVVYKRNNLNVPLNIVQPPEYTLDYNVGVLYFNTIIPKEDKNGNLIYIRVSYDVESTSNDKYYLYGGRLTYNINDFVKVGGSYFRDKHPKNLYEIKSVNLILDKEKFGKLNLEMGESSLENKNGKATLINYTNTTNGLKTKLTYYDSDENFENPNSLVKNNARLLLVNSDYVIDDKSEISVEGFKYKDKSEEKVSEEVVVDYKRNIASNKSITVGGKYSLLSKEEKEELRTLGIKYSWKSLKYTNFNTYYEYEQDMVNHSRKRLSIASEYESDKKLKFYGKYDFINTIENTNIIGRYNSSYSKLLGVEYGNNKYLKPFIEYRENNNETKDKELAFGFKANYEYKEKLKLSAVFERVEGIESNPTPRTTNLLLGYSYKEANRTSVNSIDLSDSNKVVSLLLKNSYGEKINRDLSFAIKNRYFVKDLEQNVVRDRLMLGLAYRDSRDIYNSLLKYEMVYDDQLEYAEYTHQAHILYYTQNYQVNAKNIFTLSLNGKYAIDRNDIAHNRYIRGGVDIGWLTLITDKIDFGINSAFLMDNSNGKYYGLGAEVGYKLDDTFRLAVGYNFSGFTDRDFYEDEKYQKGAYFKFKILLHENIFDRF
ncbi:hypothetical protein [Fusobacterium sp. SYSU M8A802]